MKKLSLVNSKKLTREEMKNVLGGKRATGGGSAGCAANACGAGGGGTCGTKLVGSALECVCSDERGAC